MLEKSGGNGWRRSDFTGESHAIPRSPMRPQPSPQCPRGSPRAAWARRPQDSRSVLEGVQAVRFGLHFAGHGSVLRQPISAIGHHASRCGVLWTIDPTCTALEDYACSQAVGMIQCIASTDHSRWVADLRRLQQGCGIRVKYSFEPFFKVY